VAIREKLGSIHEDLQYDYGLELEALDRLCINFAGFSAAAFSRSGSAQGCFLSGTTVSSAVRSRGTYMCCRLAG